MVLQHNFVAFHHVTHVFWEISLPEIFRAS